MRSPRSRSTDLPRRPGPGVGGVDVYLLPAVVGGGLGDIEEVLSAGQYLARAGFPITLYRDGDRPLPRGVNGPWAWPRHRRVARLGPAHRRALTIAPAWGVSAAPPTPGPLGGPGPWSVEAAEIERAYGAERTLHVSLEEFARTLTLAEESRERWREGGVKARELSERRRVEAGGDRFAREFRRFRAFDRPNVLHLFAGLSPSPAFARTFPEAVQTGPLWPFRQRRARAGPGRVRTWFWYASPASSEAIAPDVVEGLAGADPPIRLFVRTPRPWRTAAPSLAGTLRVEPIPPARWRAAFDRAEVRIVTGSRSLLDALGERRPFLYFNGVLGSGPARRRHRPEKIQALLRLARTSGWPSDLLRDLADFSQGRRVRSVVERAARRQGAWGRPFPRLQPEGYPSCRKDLGEYLVRVGREFAESEISATELVGRERGWPA